MSETVPYDDRARAYMRSGDVVAAVASQHFGIGVDATTRQRWREAMGLLREVDTMADDTDATHAEVLTALAGFTLFESRYPHLSPAALGPEVHTAMLKRTEYILDVGSLAMQTSSIKDFAMLRALEGYESFQLLGDCASLEVAAQPVFRREFLPAMGALAAAATLWDSLIDGRADVKAGKQVLQPDLEYYRVVAGAMFGSARGSLRCLMHTGPMYYGGLKLVERAVNRVKNGVPSYSNLYRFMPK